MQVGRLFTCGSLIINFGIIGISKIEFFNYLDTKSVKKTENYQATENKMQNQPPEKFFRKRYS